MIISKNIFLFLGAFFFGQLFCASADHRVFYKKYLPVPGLNETVQVMLTRSGIFNVEYETRPTPGDPASPLVCMCVGWINQPGVQAWTMDIHNNKHMYLARTRGEQELEIIKAWVGTQRTHWRSLHAQVLANPT